MAEVNIKDQKQINGGWEFLVEIIDEESKSEFKITLDKEYWEKLNRLAGTIYLPEEWIRKSVEFLLLQEPKESILKEFNLREINRYFPEYEKEIMKMTDTNVDYYVLYEEPTLNERNETTEYLRIDQKENSIDSLGRALAFLSEVEQNPFNWKWFTIALHNAAHSFMLLAL